MKVKEITYTLAMFRVYRILVICLSRNKKVLNCSQNAAKYLEIINDMKVIIENRVIEPFIKWFTDYTPNDSQAIEYIELYYKEGKMDKAICKIKEWCVPVDTVKKNVERSMGKYDKEMLSKKDTE